MALSSPLTFAHSLHLAIATRTPSLDCFPSKGLCGGMIEARNSATSCIASRTSGLLISALDDERLCSFGCFSPWKPSHRRRLKLRASDDSIEAEERIVSALGYFLPLLDGVHYGRFVFMQFPVTQSLLQPLISLLKLYRVFPLASFSLFLTLYLAVARNPNFSRYVRFNTMQAVVLDVLLIPPNFLGFTLNFNGGSSLNFVSSIYSTLFLYVITCFVFGVGACLLGKTPRIPLVADTADAQVPWF
ncbi:hypothetical protein O6H91_05G050900 [Diphasiastrum complanatum]|uniref:Uncharacterized protein n=1 Tax=Diphasiastrum complanatum TaxID=34168 RepID=A0ACC2DN73_DIPCM|nr:hypothetical protein O6H91_05G050900 [Diphasiastrum complanatum]